MKDIKLSENNRKIVPQQVERLKLLMAKYGYIQSMPIIVNEDGEIIDGQHRYLAAKELNIEAPIVIEKQTGALDFIPVINSSQLKWTVDNYVDYFANKGYPDFIALRQLCKAKNIKTTVAFAVINNGTCIDRSGVAISAMYKKAHPIKSGTFKFPDLSEKGLKKIERRIDGIIRIADTTRLPKTDKLMVAIIRLAKDPNFSFAVMESKIERQRSRLYRCGTIQEYMTMLANIYNNMRALDKRITV